MTELVERLRSAHKNSQQRPAGSDISAETADDVSNEKGPSYGAPNTISGFAEIAHRPAA